MLIFGPTRAKTQFSLRIKYKPFMTTFVFKKIGNIYCQGEIVDKLKGGHIHQFCLCLNVMDTWVNAL